MLPNPASVSASPATDERLRKAFGPQAYSEGPMAASGLGRKFHNCDMSKALTPDQAGFMIDALSEFRVISFPGQNLERFDLKHFERIANHFGAPCPHPQNFKRGGKHSYGDGTGEIELIPLKDRDFNEVARVFPGVLSSMTQESPAVVTLTNVTRRLRAEEAPGTVDRGGKGSQPKVQGQLYWHCDMEFEPVPANASLILVQHVPTARDPESNSWVNPKAWAEISEKFAKKTYHESYNDPAFAGLTRLRLEMPMNAETPFADTTAAFAALPKEEQEKLAGLRVRRRGTGGSMGPVPGPGDGTLGEGWLVPLVAEHPRTKIRSLHSPDWANRQSMDIPPVEVEGMTAAESRAFLDRLEAHVLQPQFRHNWVHTPGDLTIWSNFGTLHSAPPVKVGINEVEDARLMYRMTVKGPPAVTLPRKDDHSWIEKNLMIPYTTPRDWVASE